MKDFFATLYLIFFDLRARERRKAWVIFHETRLKLIPCVRQGIK